VISRTIKAKTNLTTIDESDLQLASWSALPSDEESFSEGSLQPSPPSDMPSQLGSKDLVFISLHLFRQSLRIVC